MAYIIKKELCRCFNCNAVAMQKVEIDYKQIEADKQMAYNDGFNKGYETAKNEIRKKLNL